MKLKLLLVLVIISIGGCKNEKDPYTSPLNYLPEEAGIVIRVNNISQLKSELKNNTFIESMKSSELYDKISEKVNLLDLIPIDTTALLAFIPKEINSTEMLVVLPLLDAIMESESLSNASIETLEYQNISMKKITFPEASFFSAVNTDRLIISSSKEVLANAINKNKDPEPDQILQGLYGISNPDKSATIFIKTNDARIFEQEVIKEDSGLALSNYAQWITLDLDSRPDDLILQGVSLVADSDKYLASLFVQNPPMISSTPGIAPSTADAILSFSLNDYNQFALNQKEYLSKSFVLDSLFNAVEEIGNIYLKGQKAIVLHTYSSENITEFLQNNKTNAIDFQGTEIASLGKNEFLNNFFDPLITNFEARYYTVIENAFVFSPERNTLKLIIAHYNRADTFNTNVLFKTVENSLADESSILYISNSVGLENILTSDFTQKILRDFKKAKTSDFAFAGQMVSDEKFFHTNIVIKEIGKKTKANTTTALFSLQLDAEIHTDPQFVTNHRTGKKEIVVQDVDNNLYLISTAGKVLWKKQLDGEIQGKISQVDIYKNGRLQLAFTTSNRFMILDRNGKEVRPFNMKFDGSNLNSLAVFDYEGSKNYRFVVTQGTNVFMYNSKGQIVKGFKYTKAESNILFAPKHFRIGQKDYLVFMLENGALKILSRAGNLRIKVNERIEFSENQVLLYKDKFTLTDKGGTLFAIDQKGGISKTKFNLNEDHGADATSKTLATMNDNVLTIKGKKTSLDLGVYTRPRIFYIYDKIYVSVTDLQSKQTYLFDSNAKPITNFPVAGASLPDLADIDNDRKIELVTREGENSLVVYKMN